MPDPFDVTDPLSGSPSADVTPANPLEEENRRLKQKLAQNENMLQQAKPLVELTRKLWNAPGGREIVEKLQKGEPLSAQQTAQVQQAQAPQQGQTLTREDVKELMSEGFQQFEQQNWESRKAERAMADLHSRASKELGEGYDNIAGSQQWNQALNTVLNMMQPELDQEGKVVSAAPIQVPEEEDDPYYYAVKYTYGYLTGSPPKTEKDDKSKADWKSRQAKSGEDKRRAAIAAQASKPAGAPTDDDEPDSPDLDWARSRGSSTVGKSFANG